MRRGPYYIDFFDCRVPGVGGRPKFGQRGRELAHRSQLFFGARLLTLPEFVKAFTSEKSYADVAGRRTQCDHSATPEGSPNACSRTVGRWLHTVAINAARA